jgi:hypothetical protein
LFTRRTLFKNIINVSAGMALTPSLRSFAATRPVLALTLGKAEPVKIPSNFIGLGYEMSSVATPDLLSAANDRYVRLVKGIGPEGVLRVGGIVADYTRYEASGKAMAEPKDTVITRERLDQFNGFLKKIGWSTIWSVNFAQGTLDDAVKEARAVASVLGPRLLALEIGNEVENYAHGNNAFRKAPYTYENYRSEYNKWHDAILKAVPGVRFAAPDTAGSVEWVERMAKDANGDVQLLTTHYYRGGQKQGSAEQLLYPNPRLRNSLERLRAAANTSGIPWRMCETNSFSGGGLPTVSDTFLGALWTLDFMLLLATSGCAGVNIETGVNQLGFVSSYSPIQDDGKGDNRAGIPYYGMLAFAEARQGCTEAMPIDVPEPAANITAYALGSGGKVHSAVLINRGESDLHLSVTGIGLTRPYATRLLAPSISSTTDVTFGGAAVDESGHWAATKIDRVHGADVLLPKMSAVVLGCSFDRYLA